MAIDVVGSDYSGLHTVSMGQFPRKLNKIPGDTSIKLPGKCAVVIKYLHNVSIALWRAAKIEVI